MRTTTILFLMTFLLLTGCDSLNVRHYCIAAAATSSNDREKIKAIIASVATKSQLKDAVSTSKLPNTLVYYNQPEVENFRVELGARLIANDVQVDLFAGFGPTPSEFNLIQNLLEPLLIETFGNRVNTSLCVGAK